MLTVEEAILKVKSLSRSYGEEIVPLEDAYGRILAEAIWSDRDYPPFNRATMDGVALRYSDFEKGIRHFKIYQNVFAGTEVSEIIPIAHCIKIMTGAAVPEYLDLLVRIEDVEIRDNAATLNIESVNFFQNIARQGEDLLRGSLIINAGVLLTHSEISSLAVVGKDKVKVKRQPTIAIVSTGNEIKSVKDTIARHQIRDSNSFAIAAFLKNYGIQVSLKRLVQDNKEQLAEAITEALQYDIVITTGGVSMGDADFLPEIFNTLGIIKDFHKVQVKPGKPIWVGHNSNTVIFGLPGNPVSVQVGCKVFIEPFLRESWGLEEALFLKLPLLKLKKKKTKFDEFFPCKIISKDFSGIQPIEFNGSGDITATLHSHGLGLHPSDTGDLTQGEIITFLPWKPL